VLAGREGEDVMAGQKDPMRTGRLGGDAITNTNSQYLISGSPRTVLSKNREDLKWAVFMLQTLSQDIKKASEELDRINNQSQALLPPAKSQIPFQIRAFSYSQVYGSLPVRFALAVLLVIGLIRLFEPEAKSTIRHFFKHKTADDNLFIPPRGFPEQLWEMREVPMEPLKIRSVPALQTPSTNSAAIGQEAIGSTEH
jgi:hypothetical protein